MPSLGSVRIDEMLVQDVVQDADWNSHQREVQVVIVTANIFQQGDAADVQQVRERGDHQKAEEQFVVLVLENKYAVGLEIEQDTDDCSQEVGHHVGMGYLEQMLENVEKQIIDKQPEERVQDGR